MIIHDRGNSHYDPDQLGQETGGHDASNRVWRVSRPLTETESQDDP